MPPIEELSRLVQLIPIGKAISYGELGQCLTNPASGYFVGRWMSMISTPVPWWRVVAKNGFITTQKRSPELGAEQVQRLIDEGIKVEGGRVPSSALIISSDLLL